VVACALLAFHGRLFSIQVCISLSADFFTAASARILRKCCATQTT
jgi:hypothetical protein